MDVSCTYSCVCVCVCVSVCVCQCVCVWGGVRLGAVSVIVKRPAFPHCVVTGALEILFIIIIITILILCIIV